jgi:hypothetical protein
MDRSSQGHIGSLQHSPKAFSPPRKFSLGSFLENFSWEGNRIRKEARKGREMQISVMCAFLCFRTSRETKRKPLAGWLAAHLSSFPRQRRPCMLICPNKDRAKSRATEPKTLLSPTVEQSQAAPKFRCLIRRRRANELTNGLAHWNPMDPVGDPMREGTGERGKADRSPGEQQTGLRGGKWIGKKFCLTNGLDEWNPMATTRSCLLLILACCCWLDCSGRVVVGKVRSTHTTPEGDG